MEMLCKRYLSGMVVGVMARRKRPAADAIIRANFSMPNSLYVQFRTAAEKRDEPMSQVVRRMVREYIAAVDAENGEAA